jgi:adenylate kinase family enzyme
MGNQTTFQPGRRIAVLGTSGCGKTYVAKRLAEILGVTYICSDAIFWGPDWTMTPPDERLAAYDRATNGEAWTFDGNVDGLSDTKGALILGRADTLIWLDLPRWRVFLQVLRRTIRRAWTKEPMWHNNAESWRMSFFSRDSILLWSMQTYSMRKKKYGELFKDPAHAHLKKLRLTGRRQVNDWLASLGQVIA